MNCLKKPAFRVCFIMNATRQAPRQADFSIASPFLPESNTFSKSPGLSMTLPYGAAIRDVRRETFWEDAVQHLSRLPEASNEADNVTGQSRHVQ